MAFGFAGWRVEDDDELADAGGEGLFGGFSVGSEFLIVRGDDRIGAACDQRGHVEGGPDRSPPAGDCLSAAMGAAVAIDRGDADEGCDFASIEAPEFGQLGDEGASACQAALFRIAPSMSRSSSESSACRRSTCRSMALSTRR